jgi:hypothetical protein
MYQWRVLYFREDRCILCDPFPSVPLSREETQLNELELLTILMKYFMVHIMSLTLQMFILRLLASEKCFFSFEHMHHKVHTYKEYHSVCPSSELRLSQPLSRQRVFPSPQKQGGGGTLACGWGVGGSPNSDEGHTLWYSLYVRTL